MIDPRLKHLQVSLVALLIVFAALAGRIPARRRYLAADPPPTHLMLPVPMTPKGRVFAPTLLPSCARSVQATGPSSAIARFRRQEKVEHTLFLLEPASGLEPLTC